jgi:L-iditol 2-dehydrogenase
MRVAVYYNNQDVRVQDFPIPQINLDEVLVKVFASGICGTDVMQWYRTKKPPRVLGHEIAGEVVAAHTDKYRAGQRVFVSHHVPCNRCKYCLAGNHTACDILHGGNYDPGGYSEFVRVPKMNVDTGIYVLPDHVSYEEGTMIEPLACAVRAQRVIGVGPGQVVLILGCGVSGLMNIPLAKMNGAKVVAADINAYRLDKAKYFGADEILNANQLLDVKADKVILCTGAFAAVKQAFHSVDRKGTVLLFAIPDKNIELPTESFWRNEVTVTSSYGAAPRDLEEALGLITNKKVNVKDMITHRLRLEDIQQGFNLVSRAQDSLKVVLEPHQK